MRKSKKFFMMLALACSVSAPLFAQEVREITFNEDRDQTYMSTKTYKLEHAKAADLTPFVLAAVKRRNSASDVQRLSYSPGKAQYLVVTAPTDFFPYVDDMIAKMDRGGTFDDRGSSINDTGIARLKYAPHFRSDDEMVTSVGIIKSGDGNVFRDAKSGIFYLKDSPSDLKSTVSWLKALDRPVPQLKYTLTAYEMTEDNFTELGIDYVNWKNGPGMNLIGAGWNYLSFDSLVHTNPLNIIADGAPTQSIAGFAVAPQIDATFLRMLAQKGKANTATAASLTISNDLTSTKDYQIIFTPNYQNITKDSNQATEIGTAEDTITLIINNPVINFNGVADWKKGDAAMGTTPSALATTTFKWELIVSSTTGHINTSQYDSTSNLITNEQRFASTTAVACNSEKLLGSYEKENDITQYSGMPFLKDIPGLRYLVGAAVTTKSRTRYFITVKVGETQSIKKSGLNRFSGKLVETDAVANQTTKQ